MRELYPYQQKALDYLLSKQHCALFMEMRLGKSLVTIRALESFKGRILVVCPKSVINTWLDELELENAMNYSWFVSEHLKPVFRKGFVKPKWNVMNYEAVLKLSQEELSEFQCVVLDESVRIKSPTTKLTKFFIENFRNTKKRVLLSGNPAPNTPLEYFTQMQFLFNEWLRCENYWQFRQRYFASDMMGWQWWCRASSKEVIKIELQKVAFILTRKDAGVENKKIYQTRYVEMPVSVRKHYKTMEEKFVMELPDGKTLSTKYVLPQLSYLSQIAGGHILKKEMSLFKINELLELLNGELKKEKVIVWCRFRWEIEAIQTACLDKKINCKIINGDTPLNMRKLYQETFNTSKTMNVLIMQVQTGKYGLNLSVCSTAIYYSNTFVPDDRHQSEMRIEHNEKHEPLLYIDLVTKNTVDEQVLEALKNKYKQSRFFLENIVEKIKEKYEK